MYPISVVHHKQTVSFLENWIGKLERASGRGPSSTHGFKSACLYMLRVTLQMATVFE